MNTDESFVHRLFISILWTASKHPSRTIMELAVLLFVSWGKTHHKCQYSVNSRHTRETRVLIFQWWMPETCEAFRVMQSYYGRRTCNDAHHWNLHRSSTYDCHIKMFLLQIFDPKRIFFCTLKTNKKLSVVENVFATLISFKTAFVLSHCDALCVHCALQPFLQRSSIAFQPVHPET